MGDLNLVLLDEGVWVANDLLLRRRELDSLKARCKVERRVSLREARQVIRDRVSMGRDFTRWHYARLGGGVERADDRDLRVPGQRGLKHPGEL